MSQISLEKIDRLTCLIEQSKAVVAVSGCNDNIDTLSPKIMSDLFGLLQDQLTEMDKSLSELTVALQARGGAR